MRVFVMTAFFALASAKPAYNYHGSNFNAPIDSSKVQGNSQRGSHQEHPFLQEALQSLEFSQPAPANKLFSTYQQQSVGFQGSASNQFVGQFQQRFNYQPVPVAPIVTKDIFVHTAPEDPDEMFNIPPQAPLPPRKHYRIVFIKAPNQNLNPATLRITQAPTEEKTIIYVLSKKPDPLELQTVFQDIPPKQPSKPEVYFIKYKTQEEAAHAQQSIQAQFDKLGGTSEISDEGIAPVTSVIGALQTEQEESSIQYGPSKSYKSSNEVSSYLPQDH